MANQGGFVVENKFIKGLVTESTALAFPQDAATDMDNCILNEFGLVKRRPGLDLEEGFTENTLTSTSGAYSEYVWYTSSASSSSTFLVQQVGSTLYLFDVTTSTIVSNSFFTTIDLTDYLPSGSTLDPSIFRCSYATGNGDLLVVNRVCDPFYVTYNDDEGTITETKITIKFRDTIGLDDELSINNRPTKSASDLATDIPKHYYNILNQGWYIGDALSQWDTARTDMPSNADMVGYYRASDTDSFDNARVTAKSPGTGAAPKGHFILDVGVEDRAGAVIADGFSSITLDSSSAQEITGGTVISFSVGSPGSAFDTSASSIATLVSSSTASSSCYLGKSFTTGVAVKAVQISKGSTFEKWFEASKGNIDFTFKLYGSNTAPSNASDGTELGSGVITNNVPNKLTIASSDSTTTYKYIWITSLVNANLRVGDIKFFTGTTFTTAIRFSSVQFFAGRAWYAGLDDADKGSSIYFSQVVIDKTRYGLCYQKNDPTSEDFADLLADDGGVIKIPEIGKVQGMLAFQSQLMIFADNGVWLVKGGGSGQSFSATGYLVQRITNVGMQSPQSIVDVKGVPVWWAEDGIYTIQYDPNYDSTTVKSLTEETIKSFVLDIPAINRKFVKGTFDTLNNYVYWLFNDGTISDSSLLQTFNKCLVFNAKTSAFFPYSFDNTTANVPIIRGAVYVQDGARSDVNNFLVKFPITYNHDSTDFLTYADLTDDTNWKDWVNYNDLISSSTNELDYDSYIVAGYRIDGEAMRSFQSKYIWTFMNDKENSSAWLRGLWDFTNNPNSGKWSTPQQAYNSLTTKGRAYDDIRVSRRVIRGSGKALQVKYYSETGKPFEIIGWGLFETGNSEA